MTGPGCPDCGRPVPAASDRNGAACGCDHTALCERHQADAYAPMYHRGCSRRELRRRIARTAR